MTTAEASQSVRSVLVRYVSICIFKNATYIRDVDLTMAKSVPSKGRAYQSSEEVDATEHRLAEFSQMVP